MTKAQENDYETLHAEHYLLGHVTGVKGGVAYCETCKHSVTRPAKQRDDEQE